jgi:antitoxin component of MazEF toxin-antitoxin module
METTEAKVKKWGNSFGIIIPKEIIDKQQIKEGVTVKINIQTNNKSTAGDIFGILKKKLNRDTDDLLKEVNEDFEDE